MKRWARRVLAHFGLIPIRPLRDTDLQRTRKKHREVIAKADRVIEEYRRFDGALELYVRRK